MTAISYLMAGGQVLEGVTTGANAPGGAVATVTAGSAVISASNAFSVGQPVVFAGSFGTVTGLVAGTTYYVIPTGLSSTQFEVAVAPGGAAIVPGGAGTATPTVAALGAVEICIDQTTAIPDANAPGGSRLLTKGDIWTMLKVLEQKLINDSNIFSQ